MKIKLAPSMDSTITVEQDENGNVTSVEFAPMFTKKTGKATLCHVTAETDKGKKLESFDLVVSGTTGRTTKEVRGTGVAAAVDENETSGGPPE